MLGNGTVCHGRLLCYAARYNNYIIKSMNTAGMIFALPKGQMPVPYNRQRKPIRPAGIFCAVAGKLHKMQATAGSAFAKLHKTMSWLGIAQ